MSALNPVIESISDALEKLRKYRDGATWEPDPEPAPPGDKLPDTLAVDASGNAWTINEKGELAMNDGVKSTVFAGSWASELFVHDGLPYHIGKTGAIWVWRDGFAKVPDPRLLQPLPVPLPPVFNGTDLPVPPRPIRNRIIEPGQSVVVPKDFLGMHLALTGRKWEDGGQAVPKPTYRYGWSRTLRADTQGLTERGFWCNVEVSPGQYDWTYLDEWFAAIGDEHPVLFLIYGTPSFYQKYPGELGRWPSWKGIAGPPKDGDHHALAAFARKAKERYGAKIAAFELWNEPTLPWTNGVNSFDDRWSPAWGQANLPNNPSPFYSGTASEMANMAFTLNTAGLGVPIVGWAIVDQHGATQTSVERFLNAPVTIAGGSGKGRDHIQGLSVHHYDYKFEPASMIAAMAGYRQKLIEQGMPDFPIWMSEVGGASGGKFSPNDARAPTNLKKWALGCALMGGQACMLYHHGNPPSSTGNLSDPPHNPAVQRAIDEAYEIGGQRFIAGAVLDDFSIWASTGEREFLF